MASDNPYVVDTSPVLSAMMEYRRLQEQQRLARSAEARAQAEEARLALAEKRAQQKDREDAEKLHEAGMARVKEVLRVGGGPEAAQAAYNAMAKMVDPDGERIKPIKVKVADHPLFPGKEAGYEISQDGEVLHPFLNPRKEDEDKARAEAELSMVRRGIDPYARAPLAADERARAKRYAPDAQLLGLMEGTRTLEKPVAVGAPVTLPGPAGRGARPGPAPALPLRPPSVDELMQPSGNIPLRDKLSRVLAPSLEDDVAGALAETPALVHPRVRDSLEDILATSYPVPVGDARAQAERSVMETRSQTGEQVQGMVTADLSRAAQEAYRDAMIAVQNKKIDKKGKGGTSVKAHMKVLEFDEKLRSSIASDDKTMAELARKREEFVETKTIDDPDNPGQQKKIQTLRPGASPAQLKELEAMQARAAGRRAARIAAMSPDGRDTYMAEQMAAERAAREAAAGGGDKREVAPKAPPKTAKVLEMEKKNNTTYRWDGTKWTPG